MPIKILFLSDINSAHTQKWALALADKGYLIRIFSLNKNKSDWFKGIPNIEYTTSESGFDVPGKKELGKLEYLKALPELKRVIKSFQPDILHAHYATSYGLLGALSGFHPFVLSVWGSDVYEFPQTSFLHKSLLKRNLRKADYILSTSNIMAIETAKYTDKKIHITPFGVDLNVFKPMAVKHPFNEGDIVIGTIKALELKYGINYLIESFEILCKKHPELPLKLLIVGKGSQETTLRKLCKEKGIEDNVKFTGWIKPEEVPLYHNMLDIFVALSVTDSESFGVAVIEASACSKPVVVSNVSGFEEVVENGITGIIVPRRDSVAAANAIEKIVLDKKLGTSFGEAGRKRVEKLYNWTSNLDDIMAIYNVVLQSQKL